jgi:hypothetical protein
VSPGAGFQVRRGLGEGGSGGLVIHRVTKEISSSGVFRTNYHDWAALMLVMLQVSVGTDDYTEDLMALKVLTKAVPHGSHCISGMSAPTTCARQERAQSRIRLAVIPRRPFDR